MITVVIAEDHQALIDGIQLFFQNEPEISIVGEATNGEQLINLVRELQPDVVITDIRMPVCNGIEATKVIMQEFPQTKVIAFSMFDQQDVFEQMKSAGAVGYILKISSLLIVVEAIRTVINGATYFDKSLLLSSANNSETASLSQREKEIIELIGKGNNSYQIAELLFISKSTVDTHRRNITKKISTSGKTKLLHFALNQKIDL